MTMTTLERENAIRRLIGKPEAHDIDSAGYCVVNDWWVPAYYGGIDSIGMVLRDVVPRLGSEGTRTLASGRGFALTHDMRQVCFDSLAAMPAACCDALLRKEGILT